MRIWYGSCSIVLFLYCGSVLSENLIRNGGFEEELTISDWKCNGGCTGTLVEGSQAGDFSFQSADRTAEWQGPWQKLSVNPANFTDTYYSFEGYVMILQSVPNQLPQLIKATMRYTFLNQVHSYDSMVTLMLTPEDGWTKLSISYYALDIGPLDQLTFYISGPDVGINFLADSLSLTKMVFDDSWKRTAKRKIESSLRKGKLKVIVKSKTKRRVKIEVKQLKHEFGFGSAVDSVTLQTNDKYKQWYLENFEWAVLTNDLKWKQTERIEGVLTWNKSAEALKILDSYQKPVRGHTVFWASKDKNPQWVQEITDPDRMYDVLMKRIDDLFNQYKNRLVHWDVNNEMLTNSFYMDIYNSDPSIRYDMFRQVKQKDPSAKLFLNDYNVVKTELRTQMYVKQAKEFLAAGAPVEAMGVQSHLEHRPEGAVITSRLDKLAEAGLPIWITELDYGNPDHQKRADVLEDVLLAYFGHPSVEGVLFWGFWDGKHPKGSDAALVNGDDLVENEAGKRWKQLFHHDWRTQVGLTKNLKAKRQFRKTIKGFYGEYNVTVKSMNDEVITFKLVTLTKKRGKASVKISI